MPPSPALIVLGLFFSPIGVLCGSVQKPGLSVPSSYESNAASVKNIFKTSYEAYRKYAFGHDELHPTEKSFGDSRNGWGATIVDAMTTAHIMGFDDYFNEAVNFSSHIDFSVSKTSDKVSVFETTIRYVAGILSAHQMSNEPALLDKAKQLADKLALAWVGSNDIPFGHINFSNNSPDTAVSNIAEAGTLLLEWTTLSNLTGNDTYARLADKAMRRIIANPAPLPALQAQSIDPSTGSPVGSYITWGGGSDSYFEYLIKYARLSNSQDQIYANTWLTAVDSSMRSLLQKSSVGNNVYLADMSNGNIRNVGSHLACFHGGNWILGAKLNNNDTILNAALQLVDGCWNTYAGTATGIGPEGFAYRTDNDPFPDANPTFNQLSFYNDTGFYITSSSYLLRPEVMESNFYAWRATGDTKYLDRAASVVKSFNKFLAVNSSGVGYDGLQDVNNGVDGGGKLDNQESFFFAETLKYLFLTFDDPARWSLDDYVFNTEAHPFKAPPALASYGTRAIPTASGSAPSSSRTNRNFNRSIMYLNVLFALLYLLVC